MLMLPDKGGFEALQQLWTMDIHSTETRRLVFWDTFEWGVWFGGCSLYSCAEQYYLTNRQTGWTGIILCEETSNGKRCFWQDFKTVAMQSALKGKLGLRRLIPVAEGLFQTRQCDLRNELEKVVCRLELNFLYSSTDKLTAEPLLDSCQIMPLLGYESEALKVEELLAIHGARPCVQTPLEFLLQRCNKTPQIYTLRPSFGLCHETPAIEAIGCIVSSIRKIAETNLPGILQDLDTEFLHDYRICLRKIRSLLSLVPDVYPPEETARIRNSLGDWARKTNRLRDLDVYLLSREEYLAMLPPPFRPALEVMFDDFVTERKREVRNTTAQLSSKAHRQFFHYLAEFFSDQAQHNQAPASNLPVGPLVFRAITKRYRKIRKLAGGIQPGSPDNMLHQIRIECKKLRYLMEFFDELIPETESAILQKQLRRLQSRLGDFNDASVQQASLLDYWHHGRNKTDAALGLGGLVSILYQRQQQSRALITESIDEFCSTATARIFKQTFRSPLAINEKDSNEV